MRKLFKERKLFKGGNYMRKYGMLMKKCTNFLAYIKTVSLLHADGNLTWNFEM